MSSHPLARAVEGVQERTVSGALITGGCVLLILSLLTGELSSYFSPAVIHHLGVDDGDASIGSRPFHVPDRLPIELSATFAHVKCDDLELSVEDGFACIRSSSRVGDSDLGVNKKRVNFIAAALRSSGWDAPDVQ